MYNNDYKGIFRKDIILEKIIVLFSFLEEKNTSNYPYNRYLL